jgi:hypothetical protein
MPGEPSKPEGTFGSFLEMLNAQKPAFPSPEQTAPYDDTITELEEHIVRLLTLLQQAGGGPILLDDYYQQSGIRLLKFGEALNVMLREGLIVIQDGDQVWLGPSIQGQI